MNFLNGVNLLTSNGQSVLANHALKDKKVICFYFSAHWCPPCRQFTPLLATAYSTRQDPAKHEVIFVSSDRSPQDQMNYMKEAHGNWLTIPMASGLSQTIGSHYGIRGIPALIVVNVDGSVITKDGRSDVMGFGSRAFELWESQAAAAVDTSVVDLLVDNPPEIRKEAGEILVKLFSNVLRDPQNMKYRSVKLSNPKIESKLLVANGAFEILFSAGFEESTDCLVLPYSISNQTIQAFKDAVEKVTKDTSAQKASVETPKQEPTMGATSTPAQASTSQQRTPKVGQMNSAHEFRMKLQSCLDHVRTFYDPIAQAKALKVIPKENIKKKAKTKYDAMKKSDETVKETVIKDLELLELLDWFKNDFFTWMDQPDCPNCHVATKNTGLVPPSQQEQSDGADRVEGYECPQCKQPARFPRYHRLPEKLLETRTGRCGEWANCFALICASMGFDTRHVLDWTDHVWVEVFSEAEGRWLHADPCENVCDKPLMYEVGWGKNLSYVIAASKDEIQDVTWRYSVDHEGVKRRRQAINENALNGLLLALTNQCQTKCSPEEKQAFTDRRLKELVEFLPNPNRNISKEEQIGRQSGSAAWRASRGEIGGSIDNGTTWRLNEEEKNAMEFSLDYNVVTDEYTRGESEKISGWRNGVTSCENIFKKEERDWKMAYLARTEGSEKASISWTLDITDTDLEVKSVELLISSKTFENGRIIWQLCGSDASGCIMPTPGTVCKTDYLAGAKTLNIKAQMSGGKGDLAWQHTQLFRTKTSEREEGQFQLKVKFQKV